MAKYFITFFVFLCLLIHYVRSTHNINCYGKAHCDACKNIYILCMLSGTQNVNKCFACAEKQKRIKPCLVQQQSMIDNSGSKIINAFTEMEDGDFIDKGKLHSLIEEISHNVHQKVQEGTIGHPLDVAFKEKIIKLCNFANYFDNFETSKKHKQASPEEVEKHIADIVKQYDPHTEDLQHIKNVLSNPALCLRDPNEWVKDRAGFKDDASVPPVVEHVQSESLKSNVNSSLLKKNYGSSNVLRKYDSPTDIILKNEASNVCNERYCNRFGDPTQCENKIRILNQGSCGNCWAFATNTVLAAYRCRSGLGPSEASVKYLHLCKAFYYRDSFKDKICSDGGNVSSFIKIMEKNNFLPTSFDLPYEEPLNEFVCPYIKKNWHNLWEGTQILEKVIGRYLYNGYLLYSFIEYSQRNDIASLIKILKKYIIEQGAVFVSMHTSKKLTFDHNGKIPMMNCEYYDADHALALVGYGDYTKPDGTESSYWIIRNSWGDEWGDGGNFKLDMYGPPGCNGRVLTTAYPLLLKLGNKPVNVQFPDDLASTDKVARHDAGNRGNDQNSNTSPDGSNDRPSNGKDDRAYIKKYNTTFKVRVNGIDYSRNVISLDKNEFLKPESCLRSYSPYKEYDQQCQANCQSLITLCSINGEVGDCLNNYVPDDKCFYCGM